MKSILITMLCILFATASIAQNVTQADIDAKKQEVTRFADEIKNVNTQIADLLRQAAAKRSAARTSKDASEKARLMADANAITQQANVLKEKVKAMRIQLDAAKRDLAALQTDFRNQHKPNKTLLPNAATNITPINNDVRNTLTPKPDLKVTITNVRNSGVDDSDPNMYTVSINCGIKNVGNVAVSNVGLTLSMMVTGRSSDYNVFSSEVILVEPIAPNQNKTGTYIFKIPYSSFTRSRPTAPYSRKATLRIDDARRIAESNEDNNISNEFNVVVR